jgi:hypothetical protein
MGFNVLLALSWAYHQQEKPISPECAALAEVLIRKGTSFRLYVVFTLPKVIFRLFLSRSSVVTLHDLRIFQQTDGIMLYQAFVDAAVALAGIEDREIQARLGDALV